MERFLSALDPVSRMFIELRFYGSDGPLPLGDVADRLGLSLDEANDLEEAAMRLLNPRNRE